MIFINDLIIITGTNVEKLLFNICIFQINEINVTKKLSLFLNLKSAKN